MTVIANQAVDVLRSRLTDSELEKFRADGPVQYDGVVGDAQAVLSSMGGVTAYLGPVASMDPGFDLLKWSFRPVSSWSFPLGPANPLLAAYHALLMGAAYQRMLDRAAEPDARRGKKSVDDGRKASARQWQRRPAQWKRYQPLVDLFCSQGHSYINACRLTSAEILRENKYAKCTPWTVKRRTKNPRSSRK